MNSTTPVISFIVPVYGVEPYLPKCLGSIAGQTMWDWECILVDDGSPDGSGAICDSWASRDDRFKVIHKSNAGVSEARNDGIEAAQGKWAYFVDSDDWLEIDAAEMLLAAAESSGADCVMSYCEAIAPGKRPIRYRQFREPFVTRDKTVIEEIQKWVLYQPYSRYYTPESGIGYAAPWGKFARLSVIKDNNVRFDSYLNGVFDDGLYSLNLLEYCESFCYIQNKTYNYRIVEGSLIHSFKKNAMKTQKRGYERIEEFMKETGKDKDFWEAYYAHVVRFFGGYLSRYYFNPDNPKDISMIKDEILSDLDSEPFKTAARNANIKKLVPRDKYLALCERKKSIIGLRGYLSAKRLTGHF